jgi:hypothetical protein
MRRCPPSLHGPDRPGRNTTAPGLVSFDARPKHPLQILILVAVHSSRLGFERATHPISLPELFDVTLE